MPDHHPPAEPGTTDRFVRSNLLSRRPGLGPPLEDGDLGSVGGIRLLRELGSGGAATVYQGRVRGTDECVAVKVFGGEVDAALRAQVEQEAAAAGALKETGLFVRVKSHHPEHTPPYLIMDYVPGETLAERLARSPGARLAAAEAARIGCAVARALESLHGQSLVHQDVKPANVYLPEPGPGGRPAAILLDLGAAFRFRHRGPKRARTRAYASPEQLAAAGDVTPPTDVYSLGTTLYHMLAGGPPPTRQPDELAKRLRGHRVPPALAGVCIRCLERSPRNRPAPARVAEELAGYLGRRARLWRRVRLAVGAGVFVAVAVVSLSLYQAERAAAERVERGRSRVRALEEELDGLDRASQTRTGLQVGRVATALTEGHAGVLTVPWLVHNDFIRERAARLKTLLDDLDADPGGVAPDDRAVVRVARGTLALLDWRFEVVLDHLPRGSAEELAGLPVLAQRARLVRAAALDRLDRQAEAEGEFRVAADYDPDSFFAAQGLAHALSETGRKAEAVERLDRYIARVEAVLAAHPDLPGHSYHLAHALIAKAAIEGDIKPDGPLRGVATVTKAERILDGLHGPDGFDLTELQCGCALIRFELLAEAGERDRALWAGREAVTLLRGRGEPGTVVSVLAANRFVARLERMAEATPAGPARAEVEGVLCAAVLVRAVVRLGRDEYPEAVADAGRTIAVAEQALRGPWPGELARLELVMGHAVRVEARFRLALVKRHDPVHGTAEGWLRLALADADRVIELAEEMFRRGEPAEAEYRRVLEGRLGATLWRRAVLHADTGRQDRVAADADRAAELLTRVVAHPDGAQWAAELRAAIASRERLGLPPLRGADLPGKAGP